MSITSLQRTVHKLLHSAITFAVLLLTIIGLQECYEVDMREWRYATKLCCTSVQYSYHVLNEGQHYVSTLVPRCQLVGQYLSLHHSTIHVTLFLKCVVCTNTWKTSCWLQVVRSFDDHAVDIRHILKQVGHIQAPRMGSEGTMYGLEDMRVKTCLFEKIIWSHRTWRTDIQLHQVLNVWSNAPIVSSRAPQRNMQR